MSSTWIFDRRCGTLTARFGGTVMLIQSYSAVAQIVILPCRFVQRVGWVSYISSKYNVTWFLYSPVVLCLSFLHPSYSSLVWSCCCLTSFCRKVMVLALVSRSLLPPTSVRQSYGEPSPPPLLTLEEVIIEGDFLMNVVTNLVSGLCISKGNGSKRS